MLPEYPNGRARPTTTDARPTALNIGPAKIDEYDTLHVVIEGQRFWASEKYTFVERGWAVYLAEEAVPDGWMRRHGETMPETEGWNSMSSSPTCLVTSHPVLVALSLYACGHCNGWFFSSAGDVSVPTFQDAVERVRRRRIINDFNRPYEGSVPGLSRWKPKDA